MSGRPRRSAAARAARVALALAAATAVAGCGSTDPRWNVLVFTLDTTRADHLGCYGKESAKTPHLDRLAAEGFRFAHAVSSAPVTLPSHSTIFTGTYPMAHGVRDNGIFRLPQEATTLAEILRRHGWATGAAVGSVPLIGDTGIGQGFDFFDDHVTISTEDQWGVAAEDRRSLYFHERSAARVNDALLPWLREPRERPFVAWFHYWDPHHPHVPPPPYSQLYAHDLYQGEIAYADQNLGAVLDDLERRGLLDRTLVVVVGDHGEGRGDHGEDTHSIQAYDSTLHVPLILRVPGRAGGRVIEQRVGTVDVLPTILDLLGLDAEPAVQGRSLVPLLDGHPPRQPPYYAEALTPRLAFGWGELRVLYDEPYKYIFGPRPELYRLDVDPRETRDLIAAEPEVAQRMEGRLATLVRRHARATAAGAVHDASEETRAQLAALGYISGNAVDPGSIVEELRSDGVPPQDRVGDNSLSSAAKQYLVRGDHLLALQAGRQLVERDPASAYYRGLLAMAHIGLGQAEEAARVVEAAPSLRVPDATTFIEVARRLFAAGERDRGLALAERLVAEKESPQGLYLLGEMHAELGDRERYRESLERAIEIGPDHGASRLSLAILLAGDGAFDEAEGHLRHLVESRPLNARYWLNYGVLLVDAGRPDEALAALRRAVEIHPAYCRAQVTLLAVATRRGLEEVAATAYRQIGATCRDPELIEQAAALRAGAGEAS